MLRLRVVSTMTFHLEEMSISIEAAQGASFLDELNVKWSDHNKALKMIREMLMCLDRETPVRELGLNLWRDNVIHSSKIQPRLLNTLLDLIQRERKGGKINRELVRNIIEMLVDLGFSVYQEDFEKPFLEASANFYRAESQEFIECSDWNNLNRADWCLSKEIERVSCYLNPMTEQKITSIVEEEMAANHLCRFVGKEKLVNMLLDDKFKDLGRIYNSFRRFPNVLSTIRDVMMSL